MALSHGRGHDVEELEIAGDRGPHARALHLHHHVGVPSAWPGPRGAPVRSRPSPAASRRAHVELGEGGAEAGLDDRLDVGEGDGGDLVLELLQLEDEVGREDVAAGGGDSARASMNEARGWRTRRARSAREMRVFSASPRSSSSLGISGAFGRGSVSCPARSRHAPRISPEAVTDEDGGDLAAGEPRSRTAVRTLTIRLQLPAPSGGRMDSASAERIASASARQSKPGGGASVELRES